MPAENPFSAYLNATVSAEARAYLSGRALSELNRLRRRERRARVAHDLLLSLTALIALLLPVFLLLPYSLPQNILHLVCSGLCVCMACMLFVDRLLRLPELAADSRARRRLLESLLHEYFLGANEFGGLTDEQKLLRLCARVEHLLA